MSWNPEGWIPSGWNDDEWFPDDTTPRAALSGSSGLDISETEAVNGGETLVLTLANDTWVAAGATFNAQRQAILDGIPAASLMANQPVTAVVRTSAEVVTITLVAVPDLDITASEFGAVVVPGLALAGGNPLTTPQVFRLIADVALEWLDPSLLHKNVNRRHNRLSLRCKDTTLAHQS